MLALLLLGIWSPFVLGNAVSKEQARQNAAAATIHVNNNHPAASDDNAGTEEQPLASVSKAVDVAQRNNQRSTGTRVIVHPGTYRESIQLKGHPRDTDAAIIIEAKQKGTAIISGSEIWTGWRKDEISGFYSHPWPYKWGVKGNPWTQDKITVSPIVRRREMIFAEGQPLTQVLSMRELTNGSFYVHEEKATVYLALMPETRIDSTVVEVATRAVLLDLDRKRNVTLRGLVFQHDNSTFGDSAVAVKNSSRILMEDCTVHWNNWSGLDFQSSDRITARRNMVNSNGGAGITVWKVKNLLFEDNETSANNWRGAMGRFYGWAVAGIKSMRVHNGIYRRHKAVGNQTRGMWFDYDNVNIDVDSAILCSNFADGINLEANQGPIAIRNSTICRNRNGPGIIGGHSEKVRLDGNIIYGNGGSQIRIVGGPRRRSDNWETKQQLMLQIADWQLRNNIIVGRDAGQMLVTLEDIGPTPFLKTLIQENNLWYNPANARVFKILGKDVDFVEWQRATGRESLPSRFADPRFVHGRNFELELLPHQPWKKSQGGSQRPSSPARQP
jgi:parallel beta-helix repeat protein